MTILETQQIHVYQGKHETTFKIQCNRNSPIVYSRTVSLWVYQNNGNVIASKNPILLEFINTSPLLDFGRGDVQAEAKGESFAHRCRRRKGGQSKTDIVPFATLRTEEEHLPALLLSSPDKN